MIELDTITNIFNELTNKIGFFSSVSYGIKILMSIFIIRNFINIYQNSIKQGEFDFQAILRELFYIALIFSFQPIISSVDAIVSEYGKLMVASIEGSSSPYEDALSNALKDSFGGLDGSDGVIGLLTSINDLYSGVIIYPIVAILLGIAWVINTVVLNTFIVERGFLMFLFNLILPIIIGLSAIDSHKEEKNADLHRIIRYYCVIILSGYCFVVASFAMDYLFVELTDYAPDSIISKPLSLLVYAVICVFSKVKLFGSSIQLLNKMFGI